MQVETIDQWSTQATITTKAPASGSWYGIAIGPESDEGLVRVNGRLLRAGTVLPMRARQYDVTHVRARVDQGVSSFPTVAKLQLLLFECPQELAVNVTRPPARSEILFTGTGALALAGTVPTRNRRHTQFVITAGVALSAYRVIGRQYSDSLFLVNGSGIISTTLADVTGVASANPVGFHIGGDSEAECFDELELYLNVTAAAGTRTLVDTFGEIGA